MVGAEKGNAKACSTNLFIFKMTTIVLSKGQYLEGNRQFAIPKPTSVLEKVSLPLKNSEKELAPPALTRLTSHPASSFTGFLCSEFPYCAVSLHPKKLSPPVFTLSITKYIAPWYVCCVSVYVVHKTYFTVASSNKTWSNFVLNLGLLRRTHTGKGSDEGSNRARQYYQREMKAM